MNNASNGVTGPGTKTLEGPAVAGLAQPGDPMRLFPILLTLLVLLVPSGLSVHDHLDAVPGVDSAILFCPEDEANWSRVVTSLQQPGNPDVTVTIHALCAGSDPGPLADPGTDCESDAYRLTGWRWTRPVNYVVDQLTTQTLGLVNPAAVMAATQAAANAWDAETSADLVGTVTAGFTGSGGALISDGVNRVTFETHPLAPTAVAVTSTFSSGGIAFESDARYNPIWAWSTSGSGGAFDYQNVATHEIGHTYGLGHPVSNGANSCLTMYAFVSGGALNARTLGDGDILGLRAIYGS